MSREPGRHPRWAARFIEFLVPGHLGQDLVTELDLEIEARVGEGRSSFSATLWYWAQALSLNTLRLRSIVRSRRRSRAYRKRRFPVRLSEDVRDAVRTTRRNPAYSAGVVGTFALAVGANVAVFSVVNSVLLRPLPYPEAASLVTLERVHVRSGPTRTMSGPDFRDFHDQTQALSSLTAYVLARETYLGDGPAEEWQGVETTPSLFATLGVSPLLGRTFQPQRDPMFGGDGIVLSYGLWQREFSGDSGVVGRSIQFEDRAVTVIGVMPADFYFPTGVEEYWAAIVDYDWVTRRGFWTLRTIGKLAPHVDLAAAQSELTAIAGRIDASPGAGVEANGIVVQSHHEAYVGDTRRLFVILAAAVAVILLIACANITNLGLSRAVSRQREFGIRTALGAARRQIARQLLAEQVVLMGIGAAVGVVVSHLVVRGFLALGSGNLPRQHEIAVDDVALVFAVLIAVSCGVLVGLVPAIQGTRAVRDGLRERVGLTGSLQRHRTLRLLVVAQLALSQILVIAAGLLLNSFLRLSTVRPGFDTEHTLTMQVHLMRQDYPSADQVVSFHRQITARVKGLPGVTNVGLTSHLPFTTSDLEAAYFLDGEAPAGEQSVHLEVVSEDYLSTMGIPILVGRDIAESDRPDQPMVALINQRMADQHWPDVSPVGERFTLDDEFPDDGWITVIGVVGTVLKEGLDDEAHPVAYLSVPQFTRRFGFVSGRHVFLAVRSDGSPEAVAASVRREIAALDPRVAVTDMRSTSGLVSDSVAEPRFRTVLIGSFAVLAVVLAVVGIYGVMSFVVANRTGEIGIRMAVGASTRHVLRGVLGDGTTLIVVGLGLGTLASVATSNWLSGMLFGVSALDPVTLAAATIAMAVAALGACWIPATRASRVDPLDALRDA